MELYTVTDPDLVLRADARWARNDFPWSADLAQANRDYFGNSSFRPNQREAINATLSGNDCFVLMPTGGGAPWRAGRRWCLGQCPARLDAVHIRHGKGSKQKRRW